MDRAYLDHNQLLSGGLLLMAVGGAFYYLRTLQSIVYNFLERFFLLNIEILDSDEAYHWMQVWLADRLQKTLSVSVLTRRGSAPNNVNNDCNDDPRPRLDNRPAIYFVPAVGTYFFRYRGRSVMLNRYRRESPGGRALVADAGGDSRSMLRDKEGFAIRIFSRDKTLARQLLEECRERALPADGKVDILVANYAHWSLGTRVEPRPVSSVILDGSQTEDMLADMREFLRSAEWYRQIGVPYRRGYLLHGPPGNGKTSIVKALAGELGMSVYLLMLSDPTMNDNRLNELLARVAERNVLLLEDIDCAFVKRQRAGGRQGELTFSGLLNALDGVASSEGRIVVMTTNHIDKLDPALIRPGRADVRLFIGDATADQARRLFERFFPDRLDLAEEFACRVGQRKLSMAALQDYLMGHRRDPEGAVRGWKESATLHGESAVVGALNGRCASLQM